MSSAKLQLTAQVGKLVRLLRNHIRTVREELKRRQADMPDVERKLLQKHLANIRKTYQSMSFLASLLPHTPSAPSETIELQTEHKGIKPSVPIDTLKRIADRLKLRDEKPGSAMNLAEELGIPIHDVRKCLRWLASQNAIRLVRGRGIEILSHERIGELCDAVLGNRSQMSNQ
jgi:predicted transcriptional regulator